MMRLLYAFPHPDDESFGPAPAMARQLREGHAVHLLTLTRGAPPGSVGKEFHTSPPEAIPGHAPPARIGGAAHFELSLESHDPRLPSLTQGL